MHARITIEKFSRFPLTRYWWHAATEATVCDGFAATEASARRQAERAARRLAARRVADYSLPLNVDDGAGA